MEGYNVEGFKRFLTDIKNYIKNNYWFIVLVLDWLIVDAIIGLLPMLEPYRFQVNIFVDVLSVCLLIYYLRNGKKWEILIESFFWVLVIVLKNIEIKYEPIFVIIAFILTNMLLRYVNKKDS